MVQEIKLANMIRIYQGAVLNVGIYVIWYGTMAMTDIWQDMLLF